MNDISVNVESDYEIKRKKGLSIQDEIMVELIKAEIEYDLPEEVTKKIMLRVQKLRDLVIF